MTTRTYGGAIKGATKAPQTTLVTRSRSKSAKEVRQWQQHNQVSECGSERKEKAHAVHSVAKSEGGQRPPRHLEEGGCLVRRTLLLMASMVLSLLVASGIALPAHAASSTFTVTSIADTGGATTDGTCDTCTLREAIQEANATPDADTVNFDIPNADPNAVRTITPTSALPTITEPVTIDGYSQGTISTPSDTSDDATPNTLAKGTNAKLLIQLDGSNDPSPNPGLIVEASNVVIKGLVINRFGDGIDLRGPAATSDKVQGNFIGTNASGTQALANGFSGVVVYNGPSKNLIGGTTPAARNLISGNGGIGVYISDDRTSSSTSNNRISGNLIGTDKSGALSLANGQTGVFISGASGNTVGGSSSGASNTIAFNHGYGVAVFPSFWVVSPRDKVLHNSIFSNFNIGIKLDDKLSGPTPNDPGDTDTGANGRQNHPVVKSAIASGGATTIKGVLRTKPDSQFTVQFFSNPAGSSDAGKKFIGEQLLKTDSAGNVSFSYTPGQKVVGGQTITATATGAEGTSEFSSATTVTVQ
jgi:CSLREA domain-containing protein